VSLLFVVWVPKVFKREDLEKRGKIAKNFFLAGLLLFSNRPPIKK
jgi:hypothetical protein